MVNTVGTLGDAVGELEDVELHVGVFVLDAVTEGDAPLERVAVGDAVALAVVLGVTLGVGVPDWVNKRGHSHARIALLPVSTTKRSLADTGEATIPRGELKAAQASGPLKKPGAPRPLAQVAAPLVMRTMRSEWVPVSVTRRELPVSSRERPQGELKRAAVPTSSHVPAVPEPANVPTTPVVNVTVRMRWFPVSATYSVSSSSARPRGN